MLQTYFVFSVLIFNVIEIHGLTCPNPDADVNTKVSTSNLSKGGIATYTCDDNYQLFGDSTRTCQDDGTWSGKSPICAINVALQKSSNQSSKLNEKSSSSRANDGNFSPDKSCTETREEDSPWWSVDLLQSYEITHVRITTKKDGSDIQDLEVRIGFSPEVQRNRLCTWHPGKLEKGKATELKCARPTSGEFVFIQMVGVVGSLSLCQVEVFSKQEISKDRCGNTIEFHKLGLFNRTCYEFQITSGGSFDIARQYCQRRNGGDLVHGIEPPTRNFLVSELNRLRPDMQTKMLWIGVQKEPQFISRVWNWIDGTQVEFPPWGRDQPNNYNGEQNCVVLDGDREWLWNDMGCNLNYLLWMCQFKPSCGTPDRKLNTTFSFEFGKETVQYSCPVGNKVVGDEKRNCSAGYWKGKAPSCKFIDCGRPSSIKNGVLALVDARTTYDAKVTYVCAENFTMDGNSTRTCAGEGFWEPELPKCLYSWCPEIEAPKDGKLTLSGRQSGDTAVFTCDPGYYLIGFDKLSCLLGGSWSSDVPKCRFIDCGLPENVDNGKMTLVNSTTHVGSMALYECDRDFRANGLQIRTCGSSGAWSGVAPMCDLINCGEPEIPLGGYVTGFSFEIHSTVEYHCELGHYMSGSSKTVCTKDGKWSEKSPNCTYTDCGPLSPIMKGELVFDDSEAPTYLGSTARYKCMPDYKLIGDSVRSCTKNGKWSGISPRCEEIRCPEPEKLEKSRISVSGNDRRLSLVLTRNRHQANKNISYKIGSQLTYRCERGYAVQGNNIRTCLKNGTWSGIQPKCKYIDCGMPPEVQHGVFRLLSNETSYGSVVAYDCGQNWKINGKARRFCQENGTWAGPYPKCLEVQCSSLSKELEERYRKEDEREIEPWNKELIKRKKEVKLFRILVEDGDRTVGSFSRYECRKGQKIVGAEKRECGQHGVWKGKEPKCEWIYCEKPKEIPNGRVHVLNSELKFGSIAEYFCFPNYRILGSFNRTCLANATWSGVETSCILDDKDLSSFDTNTLDGSSNLRRGASNDEPTYTGIYVGIGVSFVFVAAVIAALVFYRRRGEKKETTSSSHSSNSSTKPVESSFPPPINYSELNDPTTGNNIYEYIPDDIEPAYTNVSNSTFNPNSTNNYPNYPEYSNSPIEPRYSNSPQHSFSNSPRDFNYSHRDLNSPRELNISNLPRDLEYSSSNASSLVYNRNRGGVPSHIARRPKMPPPQPPTVPESHTGVTVNGMSINGRM